MKSITIQPIGISEVLQLQSIAKQTFTETFSSQNTKENMEQYLGEALSVEQLSSELKDSNSLFYFALAESNLVGYLKLNTGSSQTEIQSEASLEIERIYVLKAYQGKHIGQALYEKALTVARELKVHYVWLGVWEKNEKAIQFYTKNGFVEFDQHNFTLGNDVQVDILMKKYVI
jgi:ribosomal protein S18 acetylase RimI-like enzyme